MKVTTSCFVLLFLILGNSWVNGLPVRGDQDETVYRIIQAVKQLAEKVNNSYKKFDQITKQLLEAIDEESSYDRHTPDSDDHYGPDDTDPNRSRQNDRQNYQENRSRPDYRYDDRDSNYDDSRYDRNYRGYMNPHDYYRRQHNNYRNNYDNYRNNNDNYDNYRRNYDQNRGYQYRFDDDEDDDNIRFQNYRYRQLQPYRYPNQFPQQRFQFIQGSTPGNPFRLSNIGSSSIYTSTSSSSNRFGK